MEYKGKFCLIKSDPTKDAAVSCGTVEPYQILVDLWQLKVEVKEDIDEEEEAMAETQGDIEDIWEKYTPHEIAVEEEKNLIDKIDKLEDKVTDYEINLRDRKQIFHAINRKIEELRKELREGVRL